MKNTNKSVRDWLNQATREEIRYVMREGMFSRMQKIITIMRRKGESNVAIALRLHCDVRTVDREVAKIYKMVGRVINM